MCLESCNIVLNECHFCPSFVLNVISVGQLARENYEFSIKNDVCYIIVNGVKVLIGQLKNDIYMLSRSVSVMYTSSCKRPRLDNVSDSYL